MNNCPAGAAIVWSCSSNLSIASGQGTSQCTVNKTSNGAGWIQATVNGINLTQLSVWNGVPVVSSIQPPSSIPPNQTVRFKAIYNGMVNVNTTSPSNWEWQVPGNGGFMYNYGEYLDVSFNPAGNYQVVCRATNACGWGNYCAISVNVSSTGTYSLAYPNPVSDVLYVDILADATSPATGQVAVAPLTTDIESAATPLLIPGDNQIKAADPTYDIRLYNESGSQLFKATAKKGGKVQFNVRSLPNGTYYLHIYDGINPQPEKQQIIVKH